MSDSHFARRVPRYPRRFLPAPWKGAHLRRRVTVRPARFVVGLDDTHSLYPPGSELHSAPLHDSSYVGRVEEVSDEGDVTVRVWERPSGREALTTLSIREHLQGAVPETGELLWIWTWVELSGGSEKPRVYVQREPHVLSDDDRERLRHTLVFLRDGGA